MKKKITLDYKNFNIKFYNKFIFMTTAFNNNRNVVIIIMGRRESREIYPSWVLVGWHRCTWRIHNLAQATSCDS